MKYKMCRLQCVLVLVALYVVLAHSWDVAIAKGELLTFYTNGTQGDAVQFNTQNLGALAYDEAHNMMLYVDKQTGNNSLCSYSLSSRKYKYLTKKNGRKIHSLAFDPVTETLFFTDTNERSINSFSLKPGSRNNVDGNLLIKMYDGIPTDIAVDSCKGYIYWMNTNLTQPSIERARFNGTDREVVIKTVSLTINATYKLESHSLIIDHNTHKMFWFEPYSDLQYRIYTADLNGANKDHISTYIYSADDKLCVNPTNVLTVSKHRVIVMGWCLNCTVWEITKTRTGDYGKDLFTVYLECPISIVANYTIKDQIQGIQDCQRLTSLEQSTSMINDSFKIATEYDAPFCVHGVKVNGQSVCKCTPGYTGEKCDVSVCENYCLQGNCSFSHEGFPKCSCNAGYSGERCEVDVCFGYCSNNSTCSLNEYNEPVCQCIKDYVGDRCDVSLCLNYCLQGDCSVNDEGLPECRCNTGYSGERCEVYTCHGFCSNNGTCSLNEENEPVCQCVGDYEGSRCEMVKHNVVSFTDTPTQYSIKRNVTLTNLLSNYRKPTKISVMVEVL